jgi:uncharacterized protein YodC (DUF2158 family)
MPVLLFSLGEIVRLKSGGPKMTISHFIKSTTHIQMVCCTWFDVDNILHREEFEQNQLQLIG